MPIEYNKLVRDRIPEIIRSHGDNCDMVVLGDDEYRLALRAKLCEEAQEVATASPEDLITELADVYEVLDALLLTHDLSIEQVQLVQEQRRRERGGFAQRTYLLRTY